MPKRIKKKSAIQNKDRLSSEHRSWNMSRIRGKNTTPELTVRRLLHRMGYRFRIHARIPVPELLALSGPSKRPVRSISADVVLPKYKTAVFVHGCFWHRHQGCKNCTMPTHRQEFWLKKFEGNVARDRHYQTVLKKLGWKVITIWECETESDKIEAKLASAVRSFNEVSGQQ